MTHSHWAIKDPPYLCLERIDPFERTYALVAKDNDYNTITIVASEDRFRDAIMHPINPMEQLRAMFFRDEISIQDYEQALARYIR